MSLEKAEAWVPFLAFLRSVKTEETSQTIVIMEIMELSFESDRPPLGKGMKIKAGGKSSRIDRRN